MSTRNRRRTRQQDPDHQPETDGLSDPDEQFTAEEDGGTDAEVWDERDGHHHTTDDQTGADSEDHSDQDEQLGDGEPTRQDDAVPERITAPQPHPTTPAPRRVRINAPERRERSRRTVRQSRRSRSSDSDEYITSQEDHQTVDADEPPAAKRPTTLNGRPRHTIERDEAAGDGGRRRPRVCYVSNTQEAAPPQIHDPTLFFTPETQRDARYGMACARALAQMAIRDGKDRIGTMPEPELIAYNLRQMGAEHLISHVSDDAYMRPDNNAYTESFRRQAPRKQVQFPDQPGRMPLSYPGETGRASLRMPTYTGGNWTAFRQQFEKLARYYNWDDDTRAAQLHTSVQGDAADALGVADSANWTYDELVAHLDKRHGRIKSYAKVLNEVSRLHRKPDEALTAWHDKVIKIANTASLTPSQYQHVTYHGFIHGLRSYPTLQEWVMNKDEKRTLASAAELAEVYEREHGTAVYQLPPFATSDALVQHKFTDTPSSAKAPEDVDRLCKMVSDLQAQLKTATKNNKNTGKKSGQKENQNGGAEKSAAGQEVADGQSDTGERNARGRGRGRRGGRGGGRGRRWNNQDNNYRPYVHSCNYDEWCDGQNQSQDGRQNRQQHRQPAPQQVLYAPYYPPNLNQPPPPAPQQQPQPPADNGQQSGN